MVVVNDDGAGAGKVPKLAAAAPKEDKMVAVYGRTFPVKDRLNRELGGRWDAGEKCWRVPESNLAKAQEMVRRGH